MSTDTKTDIDRIAERLERRAKHAREHGEMMAAQKEVIEDGIRFDTDQWTGEDLRITRERIAQLERSEADYGKAARMVRAFETLFNEVAKALKNPDEEDRYLFHALAIAEDALK